MAGFSQVYQRTVLDSALTSSDYVSFSAGGQSESTAIHRAAVGSWTEATNATPSVKANAAGITTAAATASATLSHFAVFSAATGGVQKTDWTALAASRTVAVGDQLVFAASALSVSLD